MKIFYSHSKYKYGTEIEKSEIKLIKRVMEEMYPGENIEIINPATDIETYFPDVDHRKRESLIMKNCVTSLINSDAVVFSTINGVVGRGCLTEVKTAFKFDIPLFVINNNTLEPINSFASYKVVDITHTTREYAIIKFNEAL